MAFILSFKDSGAVVGTNLIGGHQKDMDSMMRRYKAPSSAPI